MEEESVTESTVSETSMRKGKKKAELADEFLRNFFIKFGMKNTLDNFQQEWFEKKAQGKLDTSMIPDIPMIYRKNAELSDQL